jgi:lysine 6-dehydrogenase
VKAIVLGGAGAQGIYTTKDLVSGDVFDEIVIADIDVDNAERVAREIDSLKISTIHVDVFDKQGLVKAISDADVVVNCTGPYVLLAPKVIEAVLEAEKNYIDFCDDIAAHEVIFTYEEEARKKNLTILVGVGCSPGIAPLIVMHAASYMDEVEEVSFPQLINSAEPEGPAVIYHLIDNFMGKVPAIKEGVRVEENAFEGEEIVDFGEPLGKAKVSTFGHPEIFTLPRTLKGIKNMAVKLGTYPPEDYELLKLLSQIGLASTDPLTVNGQEVVPRDFLISLLMSQPHEERNDEKSMSSMVVQVKGKKEDETVIYELFANANMGPATGIPCAIGAEMIVQGKINKKGVLAPEECIDPKPFFDEWLRRARAISKVEVEEKISTITKM